MLCIFAGLKQMKRNKVTVLFFKRSTATETLIGFQCVSFGWTERSMGQTSSLTTHQQTTDHFISDVQSEK